jgi:hypothetical protein
MRKKKEAPTYPLYVYNDRIKWGTTYLAFTLCDLKNIEKIIAKNLKEEDYHQYGAVDSYMAFLYRFYDERELETVRNVIKRLEEK